MSAPSIKRLDQNVVNRIAAGEIIHRPANALKELIENSLDAGSTQIQILIKDGGLKLLQIQDNGHGIRQSDMPIVCERFTTSKLQKFEDLSTMTTYGFRGEALASISHVAHVTITSKTADSQCAYRACYSDGKLVPPRPGVSADPKPCAGNNGTQITAEDLFYNISARRKALKSASEEYNRILDVVSRYAVHNAGVAFSCRKQGASRPDVQTVSSASVLDNIRQIYGGSVANELLHTECESSALNFKMSAYLSNANYHVKRMTLLLFINHRLVESNSIKRMIENVYVPLLPKGMHPFVYISLEINPRNVDVNVHPTKREVHFLNEEQLVNAMADAFQEKLESANYSRTFYTQLTLPGAPDINVSTSDKPRKAAPNHTIRTDSGATTLDTFVTISVPEPTPISRSKDTSESTSIASADTERISEDTVMEELPNIVAGGAGKRQRVVYPFDSLANLRDDIKAAEHTGLTKILSKHTFIGCADDTLALLQHQEDVYLVNYAVVSEELFYQIALHEFGNFGVLKLSEPLSIRDCVNIALDMLKKNNQLPDQLKTRSDITETIVQALIEQAEMLEEYFMIRISNDGTLTGLPMLLKNYIPTLDKLPLFLLRLGTEVNWTIEQDCFDGIARELAILFSAEPPIKPDDESSDKMSVYKQEHKRYLWQVQHLIFPSLKQQFSAPRTLATGQGRYVTRLTSLADLYKIFERC